MLVPRVAVECGVYSFSIPSGPDRRQPASVGTGGRAARVESALIFVQLFLIHWQHGFTQRLLVQFVASTGTLNSLSETQDIGIIFV
jgi:hypothetical protein